MPDLTNWMVNTRRPDASAPLQVQIGPGNFEGLVSCHSASLFSNVTFQGAGMTDTVIGRFALGGGCTISALPTSP